MLNINRLCDSYVCEVFNMKPSYFIDQAVRDELESLIFDYRVVILRNFKLKPEEQIEFCRLFGRIEPHPLKLNTCPYAEMTYVSNVIEGGISRGYPGPSFPIWHSDMCYEKVPPKFSFFYAERVPNKGGRTLFSDTTRAYDDLPQDIKQLIVDKYATFGFSQKLMDRCHKKGYELIINEEDQRPDCLHPIVRVHPITKKKSIFVNWTHTDSVQGLSQSESDKLLNFLYDFSVQDHYIYKHQYQKDDLIVWDNSSTLHTGDGSIALDQPRVMRRVIVNF